MAGETLSVKLRARPDRRSSFLIDVELEAAPGITILFGPSGAGKSTTLAAIAGLVRPEAGRIRLGEEVWTDTDARLSRAVNERAVGFVFQSLALFPHMTALANVAYGLPRRTPPGERAARARELLARMRVPHLADRYPATFSGGEGQRVALARAIAVAPRVLLLDEPFSAMDEALRADLQRDVRAYVDEARIPALQVTHQRDEARRLADRIVVLDAGRVVAAGSADVL